MTQRVALDAQVQHTFADLDKRTIRGVAIPAGQTATSGGRRFRFAADSVRFGERTPLLTYHDTTKPVGRMTESAWGARGLEVAFSVSKTEAGDEALVLAADGVLGLSVGIDIPSDGARLGDDGVMNVSLAEGREVSLTPIPAFAGAVIDHVAMSDDNSVTIATERITDTVTETTEVTPQVTVNLDAEKLGESIALAMASNMPTPQPVPVAVTREEPLYRFDGGRGRHEFSSDLFAAAKGDGSARQRVEEFLTATFAVDSGDVATLNPVRNRPDLYVDERDYRYPLWDAVNKGTLADGTPFTFPKFNTAGNLVDDHTEGIEPDPGTFTATNATVTPSAVSGRVEITRETVDAGGNPQVSQLVWAKMTRAYYEALEAFAAGLLTAVTPTQITLTAGASDDTLDAELTNALARLHFIRGGHRFDTFVTHQDLFTKLVGAVDASGRRLYPILGPSNATGTTTNDFGSVLVGNARAIPSWALGPSGTVAASSYLFDRTAVHAWASAPRRLEFEYRVAFVDLAIWGWKAGVVADLAGVREVVYDPTA